MGFPRLSLPATQAVVLSLLVTTSACAAAGATRGPSRLGDLAPDMQRGPRVRIWTTEELGSGNRIRASFRLEEDAYVVVVNVGLDGYANVIFPESPEDDGFMRGGRTYRLPSFFPGFVTNFRASSFRRFHNATAAYDDVYDRYSGYVFIIASRRPMHFAATEALGLWTEHRLAAHERQLEPYVVMRWYADQLLPGGSDDYTATYARYAAFGARFGRGGTFALCSAYGSALGYFPWWSTQSFGRWWVPMYGFGYAGRGHCGYGYRYSLAGGLPFAGRPVARPPLTPTPRPGAADTARRPPRKYPRPPVAPGDSAERKSRPGERVGEDDEEETIVEVTRGARALARRGDRDADPVGRAMRGASAGEQPTGWTRSEAGRRGRAQDRTEADGRERDRSRVSRDDGGQPRGESGAREQRPTDPRSSEPRREAPPRHEPRAEPRQTTRQEPAPRPQPSSRPEPRSEPRPEPRSEPRAEPRGEPRSEPRPERPPKSAERE